MSERRSGSSETDDSPRQFNIRDLICVQAGAAIVLGTGVLANDIGGNEHYAVSFGILFAAVTAAAALVGYLLGRCFFGRVGGLLSATAAAGAAGSLTGPADSALPLFFGVLGMLVACGSYLTLAWMDKLSAPFFKREDGISRLGVRVFLACVGLALTGVLAVVIVCITGHNRFWPHRAADLVLLIFVFAWFLNLVSVVAGVALVVRERRVSWWCPISGMAAIGGAWVACRALFF